MMTLTRTTQRVDALGVRKIGALGVGERVGVAAHSSMPQKNSPYGKTQ